MKYLLIALLLVGCSTAPVVMKFPDAPGKNATERCPDLKTVNEGVKLSELTNTITMNYSTYHECAVKADAWQEWYQVQKNIFEKVK